MLNQIFVETVLKYVEITFFVRHQISTKDEYTEHIPSSPAERSDLWMENPIFPHVSLRPC